MKRGPNSKTRETGRKQGQQFKQRRRPTGLYCPNCLLELESRSDAMKTGVMNRTKVARVSTYLCLGCVKTYIRLKVLTFDEMISVKVLKSKRK